MTYSFDDKRYAEIRFFFMNQCVRRTMLLAAAMVKAVFFLVVK